MKNSAKGSCGRNDLPKVHKALGWRLDSVGIWLGALASLPLEIEGGMYHLLAIYTISYIDLRKWHKN